MFRFESRSELTCAAVGAHPASAAHRKHLIAFNSLDDKVIAVIAVSALVHSPGYARMVRGVTPSE